MEAHREAVCCTGADKHCLQLAIEHANSRQQFKKTLGNFDLVKKKIARMAADVYAMEAMTTVTASLIDRGLDVGLHCFPCGRHVVVPVRSLPFALEMPVPATAGRFKCTRCGSRQTEARPEWANEGGRVKDALSSP